MANKQKKERALSSDLNQHPRNCDCPLHAKRRADERVALWRQHGAAAPIDPSKTVFVRSFWRAQPNHFNKFPNSRNELVARLRALQRAVRR